MRKGGRGEAPFPIVRRGYDPAPVDGYLAAHTRWANDAWVRVQELEAQVAELQRQLESLRRDRDEQASFAAQIQDGEVEAERRASEIAEAEGTAPTQLAEPSRQEPGHDPRSVGDARATAKRVLDELEAQVKQTNGSPARTEKPPR